MLPRGLPAGMHHYGNKQNCNLQCSESLCTSCLSVQHAQVSPSSHDWRTCEEEDACVSESLCTSCLYASSTHKYPPPHTTGAHARHLVLMA